VCDDSNPSNAKQANVARHEVDDDLHHIDRDGECVMDRREDVHEFVRVELNLESELEE
jgi:hypothetical protein